MSKRASGIITQNRAGIGRYLNPESPAGIKETG